MGPAYFTKFLFFIGYASAPDGRRPLILDRRVATALRDREVLALGDSGWSTDDYERYLEYCHQTSPDNPEAVEIELFNAGSPS